MAPAGPTNTAESSDGGVGRGVSTGANFAEAAVALSVKNKAKTNTTFIAHSVMFARAIS